MKHVISAIAIAGLFAVTSCNNAAEKDAALRAQQHTIDSMNTELAKKKVIDSMNELTKTQYVLTPPATTAAAPATAAATSVKHSATHHYAGHATHTAASQPVVYQEAPAP